MTTEELAEKNIKTQIVLLNKIIDNQSWLIGSAKSAATETRHIIINQGVAAEGGTFMPSDQVQIVLNRLHTLSGEWSRIGSTCEEYLREIRTAKETLNLLK